MFYFVKIVTCVLISKISSFFSSSQSTIMNPILFFVLLSVFAIFGGETRTFTMENVVNGWAIEAHIWLTSLDCEAQSFLSTATCQYIQSKSSVNFRVYATEPVKGKKFGMVFPDTERREETTVYHDSVLVLDPFPASRFGHPILVFSVRITNATERCNTSAGMISMINACLEPMSKANCSRYMTRLEPKSRLSCTEFDFLPLVYDHDEHPMQMNDRLRCFGNLQGFYQTCPRLRTKTEVRYSPCGSQSSWMNREHECDGGFKQNTPNLCAAFQTCDYAVLLSGGWNRQLSDTETISNVLEMKRLLRNHGYLDENIQAFYANGDAYAAESDEKPNYYPSGQKHNIRNYIKTICDVENCADTFLIYFNGPTRQDGALMLWDSHDGMFNDDEVYTPKEFLRDVGYCKAKRVLVFLDQGYGAAFVDAALQRVNSIRNLVVFTSNDDFTFNIHTDRMTTTLLKSLYNDICLIDFKNTFYNAFKAPMFIPEPDLLNTTLVGGPCSVASTSVLNQDTQKYRGCSISTV